MRIATAALVIVASTLAAMPCRAQGVADYVKKADEILAQAIQKGDAAAVAQMHTDEAVLLPPGSAPVKGRKAIEAFFAGMIEGGLQGVELTPDSVEDYGAAAREIGHFAVTLAAGAGGAPQRQGNYVVIWKKIDSGWKLDTDIWNLSE